jgi:molecular chaperone GrpE
MKKHAENSEAQKTAANQAETVTNAAGDTAVPPQGASAQSTAPADGPSGSEATGSDPLALAQTKIAELEQKNADLQDQYLRKAADFDNYRKRMIKEKQDAIDFANSNILVDLVQILDDFDRAMSSGAAHEPGSPGAALSEGVAMIRSRFGSMLENKYGLAYYPAKGEQFDPNLHEAIGQTPSEDVTEPTVAEEFSKGYKLKDRVIRHAKVMVKMPVEK